MENKLGYDDFHSKPTNKIKKLVAAVLSGLLTIFILEALFGPKPTTTSAPTANEQIAEPVKADLELLGARSASDGFARYIIGAVRNNTNLTYGYVQVEINLYDKSGAQVGSTFDNTTNLEPGAIWKFKALVIENSATKFKIIGVRGY